MKRTILAALAALLVTTVATVVAQNDAPKVIDSRLSVGQNASRTFTTLPPTIEAADPTGNMRIFQVRPTTSLSFPMLTFLHRATAGGADVDRWTMFLDSSLGFNIRDERQSQTRATIDASGLLNVPGGVSGPITTSSLVTNGSVQGNAQTFALTSGAAAATFVKVAIPSGSAANLLIEYVFEVKSATPHTQAFGGVIGVNAVNNAGSITCVMGVPTTATQPALAASSGTLTNAITCADATGNVLNVLATDTTSLTPTSNLLRYRVRALAATNLVITPQ